VGGTVPSRRPLARGGRHIKKGKSGTGGKLFTPASRLCDFWAAILFYLRGAGEDRSVLSEEDEASREMLTALVGKGKLDSLLQRKVEDTGSHHFVSDEHKGRSALYLKKNAWQRDPRFHSSSRPTFWGTIWLRIEGEEWRLKSSEKEI